MTPQELAVVVVAFACVAALYSTVGHAGASGYLAVMALLGVAPATMRPTALALNLVVATLATWRFWRAGWIRWSVLAPFVVASVPCAYLGGRIQLPVPGYRALVGVVLLAAAVVLWWRARGGELTLVERDVAVPRPVAVTSGAAIGLLSGLTGTGGGIFLSPLLLFAGWAGPRGAAGLAAPFIWLNSLAGLVGLHWATGSLHPHLPWFVAAVLVGGWVGTMLGLTRLPRAALLRALSVVLVIAGGKLILAS